MNIEYDVIIGGGGIVGLAVAYKLQKKKPSLRILVLEKEDTLAAHQTGHNSGVIHSGIYYKPGSLRATLCKKGREELIEFCRENEIDYDICGKLIVATDESEIPYLQTIYERGVENGTEGIRLLGPEEIKEHEPNCQGVKAILVPGAGIINYQRVAVKYAEKIREIGKSSAILTENLITSVYIEDDEVVVDTNEDEYEGKYFINCGGLQCDRLAKKTGVSPDIRIVPFRGDYYELTEESKGLVKHLIYPVPNPQFPFLGVHFTRMIDGGVECGPNAVFSFDREGYSKTAFSLFDTCNALTYGGTWKLFFKHWKYGMMEYRRAFSKQKFLESLQKLIPTLTLNDIKPGRCGIRAAALTSKGKLEEDFKIISSDRQIHVLNAPSPAATSSLAIGDYICELAFKEFNL